MAHDVFISHSAKNKPTADAVCAMLESEGIRCWIAPRDVTPGLEWSECIIEAIEQTRIMVLIFTAEANASPQIRREVERAVNRGVAILPLRMEEIMPARALEYFIGNVHWLDAMSPPLEAHLKSLAVTIRLLLSRLEPHADPNLAPRPEPVPPVPVPPAPDPVTREELDADKKTEKIEEPERPGVYGIGKVPGHDPASTHGTRKAAEWESRGGTVASARPPGFSVKMRAGISTAAAILLAGAIFLCHRVFSHAGAAASPPVNSAQTGSPMPGIELFAIAGTPYGTRLWVAGNMGTILESDDLGATWTRRSVPTQMDLHSIFAPGGGSRVWAVGSGGTIVESQDGGKTWLPAHSGSTEDLYSISGSSNGNLLWVSGADGAILLSVDGGTTWTAHNGGSKSWLYSIAGALDGESFWAVGAWGTLAESTDGGETWHAGVIDAKQNVLAVFATGDGTRVWAAGTSHMVWESDDYGKTWLVRHSDFVPDHPEGYALKSLYGDPNGAWLVTAGLNGYILRSTDRGATWTVSSSGTSADLNAVFGTEDGRHLWAVGDEGTVLQSTDGGATWTRQSGPS
jgi:photosystem II stability/assembly factor-like uncharacterized protein